MRCDEAVPLLHARLDGELAPEEARAVDAHLAACAACAKRLAGLERLDGALARDLPVAAPAGLAARLADGVLAAEDAARSKRMRWVPLLAGAVALALLAALAAWGLEAPWAAGVVPRLDASGLAAWVDDAWASLSTASDGLGRAAIALAVGLAALQVVGTAWLLGPRRREAR